MMTWRIIETTPCGWAGRRNCNFRSFKKTDKPDQRIFPGERPSFLCSSTRPSFKGRYAIWKLVKRLLVDCEDRCLGGESARIVQGSDFDDHSVRPRWRTCSNRCAAIGTEIPRYGIGQIAAGERLWFTLGKTKPIQGKSNDSIRIAAGDVLTFTAMALQRKIGLILRFVVNLSAITPTFYCH